MAHGFCKIPENLFSCGIGEENGLESTVLTFYGSAAGPGPISKSFVKVAKDLATQM